MISTATLNAIAAPYLQRPLSSGDIEQLRIALTHLYVDRGYINSGVVLDPGDPFGGEVLHFVVVEGRISKVRIHGLKGLSKHYIEERLVKAPDEVLNTNVLRDRFQLLLDDPLFSHLNSRLQPGATPGEATLDVDVDRAHPYALSVALNNYRPPSIDEKGYDVRGLVRDLTGLGDVLDAAVAGPLNGEGRPNTSGGWTFPFNHSGGQIGVRASYGETVISEQPLSALDIRSDLGRYELTVSQPLIFTHAQKLSLIGGVAREYDSTSILGMSFPLLPGAVTGDLSDVSLRFGPEYSLRSEEQYFGVRLTILYAHLLNRLQSDVAYRPPDKNSVLETLQGLHLITFGEGRFELQTRGLLQRTENQVSDLLALPVGGVDSVRGFRANTLLESNVGQINLDLRWHALPASHGWWPAVNLGPFLDWARAYDVDSPATTLMSAGGTLRLTWPHWSFDFAGGGRIRSTPLIDQQHGSWQDEGIYAQLLYTL